MIELPTIEQALHRSTDRQSLVKHLCVDALRWPLGRDDREALAIDADRAGSRCDPVERRLPLRFRDVSLLDLPDDCGWRVFLVEFEDAEQQPKRQSLAAQRQQRLRGLAAWCCENQIVEDREPQPNLLFVCTSDFEHYTFVCHSAWRPQENSQDSPRSSVSWITWDPDSPSVVSHLLLADLAWLEGDAQSRLPTRNWLRAFDIERLTQVFLTDSEQLLADMENELQQVNDLPPDRLRWFVLSLFSGLMFLRLVECKGWYLLTGDSKPLRDVWSENRLPDGELFSSWFGPLLFGGQWPAETRCRIASQAAHVFSFGCREGAAVFATQPSVPDSVLGKLIGGDGLLDRYEFSMHEPFVEDRQVVIGPQILGRVLEVGMDGRRAAGAYYTAAAAVSFMCREGLKGVLLDQTEIDLERITALVDRSDTRQLDEADRGRLDAELARLLVVDPACGAGAYLIGYLHEACRVHCLLTGDPREAAPTETLRWKSQLISRNLYGVDVDPIAIQVSAMRLWLLLARDAETPDALFGFAVHLEAGDALLGPAPQSSHRPDRASPRGDRRSTSGRLGTDGTGSPGRVVGDVQDARAAWRPEVASIDWEARFPEVFAGGRDGFDLALANPPYVRKERIPTAVRARLRKQYADAITGHSDLYCCFYARAMQVLRPGGMHVFLCSNSWLDSRYGGRLQRFLLENSHVQALYESADSREFAAADINTVVSVIRKGAAAGTTQTRFVLLSGGFGAATHAEHRAMSVSRETLWQAGCRAGSHSGDYVQNKWGGKYLRAPEIYLNIVKQAQSVLTPLSTLATIEGYIHDNNTGPQFPQQRFLKSVKRTTQIHLVPDAEGVESYGVKSQGGSSRTAPILFPRTLGARHVVVWNPQGVLGKEFYKITPREPRHALSVVVQLNSTWGMLQRELLGLSNLGDGALKFSMNDLQLFDLVRDLNVTSCAAAWEHLAQRAQQPPEHEVWQSDRQEVDQVVFDGLGLTAVQSEQVREAVCQLVDQRLSKSRTKGR